MSLSVHHLTFYFSVFRISLCPSLHLRCPELHIFVKNHQAADVLFWRTRQVDWRVATANNGQRFADEGEEEWAVVVESAQEQEDRRHYDIKPDHCWEAR